MRVEPLRSDTERVVSMCVRRLERKLRRINDPYMVEATAYAILVVGSPLKSV